MSATSMKYYQVRHIEIQLDQVYLLATGALAGVIHLSLAERYRVRAWRVRAWRVRAWECEDAKKIRLVRD